MNENTRSVLYAGGLQFCFPGLGRMYLRDWGRGIFQLLTSWMLVGLIWSWVDGYLMITGQGKVKSNKVNLVYHGLSSDQSLQRKSPFIAAVLQLFVVGLGRLYLGFWFLGLLQFIIGQTLLRIDFFSNVVDSYVLGTSWLSYKWDIPAFLLTCCVKLLTIVWGIFDSYCILKGSEVNPDQRPLNYSVAMSFNKIKIGDKDKFIAGILQQCFPGLGRFYMGYWWIGILQFLASFVIIGIYWSYVDGHHIMLNPDVDKDGKGNLLTNQYRLNLQESLN